MIAGMYETVIFIEVCAFIGVGLYVLHNLSR